ncbi:roadblock/LC7 domain-containing protein [Streptomyces sp. Q6]|uniref:Roadblock/LC7 domain-containing protein n=1 Tax=Streptomyces citrinus TaxID=3118173 RepID=A0ACD5A5L9_9ACTN
MSHPAPAQTQDLDWLLADFAARVPGTTGAILATSDGVLRHRHALDGVPAERLSAIVTGLCSMGGGLAASVQAGVGDVEQIVVQCAGGLLFVAKAGENGVLGVLTTKNADPGIIGYEIGLLVRSVHGHLGTPARTPAL